MVSLQQFRRKGLRTSLTSTYENSPQMLIRSACFPVSSIRLINAFGLVRRELLRLLRFHPVLSTNVEYQPNDSPEKQGSQCYCECDARVHEALPRTAGHQGLDLLALEDVPLVDLYNSFNKCGHVGSNQAALAPSAMRQTQFDDARQG